MNRHICAQAQIIRHRWSWGVQDSLQKPLIFQWRGQPSTSSTMRIPIVLLIMCLGIPARSRVIFTAVKHKSTKRVQVNVANMNICNGVNANLSCLLEQKPWSVNAEMINRIRLRLKRDNLLSHLRNKSCTWHVTSLLSLKGLCALSKQETDPCSQGLWVKTNQTVVDWPHQKPCTSLLLHKLNRVPQTITLVSTATDNAPKALHGLERKSELVRGCYVQYRAGKKEKSASGMADASSCLYPTCEFSS